MFDVDTDAINTAGEFIHRLGLDALEGLIGLVFAGSILWVLLLAVQSYLVVFDLADQSTVELAVAFGTLIGSGVVCYTLTVLRGERSLFYT